MDQIADTMLNRLDDKFDVFEMILASKVFTIPEGLVYKQVRKENAAVLCSVHQHTEHHRDFACIEVSIVFFAYQS